MQSHEDFMAERKQALENLPNFNEHQHKLATDEQKLKHQVEPLPAPVVIHVGVPAGDHNEEVAALEQQTEKTEEGQ